MKKILFSLIISSSFLSVARAQGVTINGRLAFAESPQKVFLNYRNGDERISDSAAIKNGRFTFKEKISEPTLASLMVRFVQKEGEKRPRMEGMQLFMEPGAMKIVAKDSLQFAKVSGSKSQTDFEAFNALLKPYNEKERALNEQYREFSKAKDMAGMKSIVSEFDKIDKEKSEKVYHKYISENPTSPVALYVLGQYAGYDIDPQKIEPLFDKLSVASRTSPSGMAFKKRIETAKKTAVGAMAMNFTQNDTLDKPVSLSDFKGKYVLVDFWASWCGPCRAENPNVVKAYHQYKDKNFTVLGVSLDQPGKKQAWLDAIHKDGLWWTQVSDLKFWNNAVAKQYGIRAIPQNLLIDPSGKIIAKNVRGEELAKKLQETLE